MSTDEQQSEPASGSVPHAYRQRLFWTWVQEMPARTSSGFVSFLYALGSAADPAGRLRFRDGQPITIKQFSGGLRADEKQVGVWVDAAIAAGVLAVEGSRRQGAKNMYVLVLSPLPDWGAAQSVIKTAAKLEAAKKAARKNRKPPPWQSPDPERWDEDFGGRSPEVEDLDYGGPSPELPPPEPDELRGTVPGTTSGDRPPSTSGDGPPYNPGFPMLSPHDGAEVGGQPQVLRATAPRASPKPASSTGGRGVQSPLLLSLPGGAQGPEPDTPAPDWVRCQACHGRLIPRPGRTTHHDHCKPNTRELDTG